MRMNPRKPGTVNLICNVIPHVLKMFIIVNERSIMSLKKRALRRTKTLLRDPETQEVVQPSKYAVWASHLKAPFTKVFWEDTLEQSDDETLVDNKLLSYAYLEAGVIEMLGA